MTALHCTTRQAIGGVHHGHGYVYVGNRVAASCSHRHRSVSNALRCARRMLHRLRRHAAAGLYAELAGAK